MAKMLGNVWARDWREIPAAVELSEYIGRPLRILNLAIMAGSEQRQRFRLLTTILGAYYLPIVSDSIQMRQEPFLLPVFFAKLAVFIKCRSHLWNERSPVG